MSVTHGANLTQGTWRCVALGKLPMSRVPVHFFLSTYIGILCIPPYEILHAWECEHQFVTFCYNTFSNGIKTWSGHQIKQSFDQSMYLGDTTVYSLSDMCKSVHDSHKELGDVREMNYLCIQLFAQWLKWSNVIVVDTTGIICSELMGFTVSIIQHEFQNFYFGDMVHNWLAC